MKRMTLLVACIELAGISVLRATDFVRIIDPNANSGGGTYVTAIDGDYIVGSYTAEDTGGSITHGFFYQISTGTYQDLLPAGATRSFGGGISGTTVVGTYNVGVSGEPQGYAYDISTGIYTTIANPYGPGGEFGITAVSGSLYYGFYLNPLTDHITSFSTDGTSFTPLSYLGSSSSLVQAAFGATTAGTNFLGPHGDPLVPTSGFFYDGTSLVTLNFPGASLSTASGTNGTLVVGSYIASGNHSAGYIYDGSSYTYYFAPDAADTALSGITNDGRMIGIVTDADGYSYGFLTATVPEPGSCALLGFGAAFGLALLAVRRRGSRGAIAPAR